MNTPELPPTGTPEGAPSGPISKWDSHVAAYATAVGKTPAELSTALQTLTGTDGDVSLTLLADPTLVTDADLQGLLVTGDLKIPLGIFRKNLPLLRGKPATEAASATGATAAIELLPVPPDDDSFIASLKVGGVLKVGGTEVLAAIKAGIADKLGFFDLPDLIKGKMEIFAESQDEPVGESYFKLQSLVTKRNYAEVLSALGIEGSFMSEAKKKGFLTKLNKIMWDALYGFHLQLAGWQQAWQGSINPALMFAVAAGGNNGGAGVPASMMMQAPPTDDLHAGAEGVIDAINKVFAGLGIPVARALAYEATRIKNVLEAPELPVTMGFANKDQMLKGLGVTVGADFVRLERSLTRFAMALMEFPSVIVPTQEQAYLMAMFQLGSTIPWEKLSRGEPLGEPTGIGGDRRKDKSNVL